MAGTLPPLFDITDEDHGGYVAVSVYTLLVLMLFVVVTRLFTRWYIGRVIHFDDILLGVSAVSLFNTVSNFDRTSLLDPYALWIMQCTN